MIVKLIEKKNFLTMPWANGLGVTTELYVHKEPQTGRMLWRISMAGVDTDGPFSHFAGYDRILVLLTGNGLILKHSNKTEHRLTCPYEHAAFPGDIATEATLVDGPVLDFNVIADRASTVPNVTVLPATTGGRIAIRSDHLAIYAVDGDLHVVDASASEHTVPQGDLLFVDDPERGKWLLSGATAIVIQLLTGSDI